MRPEGERVWRKYIRRLRQQKRHLRKVRTMKRVTLRMPDNHAAELQAEDAVANSVFFGSPFQDRGWEFELVSIEDEQLTALTDPANVEFKVEEQPEPVKTVPEPPPVELLCIHPNCSFVGETAQDVADHLKQGFHEPDGTYLEHEFWSPPDDNKYY